MAYFCFWAVAWRLWCQPLQPELVRRKTGKWRDRGFLGKSDLFYKENKPDFTNWNKYGSLKLNGKSITGLSVHRISQPRIVEWVAILFPRGSSWPKDLNLSLLHCRYHYATWELLSPQIRYNPCMCPGLIKSLIPCVLITRGDKVTAVLLWDIVDFVQLLYNLGRIFNASIIHFWKTDV